MDEIIRHIFFTGTYDRTSPMDIRWRQISRDFNRFLQNFRRLHNQKVQYIRVIEKHKDGYPHVHAILQFPNATIRITNIRYFERTLYRKWKNLWKGGHSDYQKPRKTAMDTISYVMKYCLKNTTRKTVWKKILSPLEPGRPKEPHSMSGITVISAEEPTKLYGIKICTWSRNFDWKPFKISSPQHNDDC